MFLFEAIPWYSALMWFAVLGGLMLVNEVARINKWFSLLIFLILPLVLTFAVWPTTAGEGTSMDDWFHWAKVYSALAGCLGFLAIRHIKGAVNNKYLLMFPPFILTINILEACVRDFQVFGMGAYGMVDGVFMFSGPWNIMNGIAGLMNIVTICGWMGIFISKDRKKDMLWPDMLWFWIIAYDLWNFAICEATVPQITVNIGKYFGPARLVLGNLRMGVDFVYSWPCAQVARINPEEAVGRIYHKDYRGCSRSRRIPGKETDRVDGKLLSFSISCGGTSHGERPD
jgi:hypothetical protein